MTGSTGTGDVTGSGVYVGAGSVTTSGVGVGFGIGTGCVTGSMGAGFEVIIAAGCVAAGLCAQAGTIAAKHRTAQSFEKGDMSAR